MFWRFYGCSAWSYEGARIVPSMRWVYKSISRTHYPSLLHHTHLPSISKRIWSTTYGLPAFLETPSDRRHGLLPLSFETAIFFHHVLCSLSKIIMISRYYSRFFLQNGYKHSSCWKKEQQECSKSQRLKDNGDTFMHPGAGFSFTPLPSLLAACPWV